MNEKILMLIDKLINYVDEDELNAWYEIMIEKDYDYIEDLFRTKEDFKEFIEKYKGEDND